MSATERDWFKDAQTITQEHAPRYRICWACKGEGERHHTGESLSPFSGMRVRDPQMDVPERCLECDGFGAIPIDTEGLGL